MNHQSKYFREWNLNYSERLQKWESESISFIVESCRARKESAKKRKRMEKEKSTRRSERLEEEADEEGREERRKRGHERREKREIKRINGEAPVKRNVGTRSRRQPSSSSLHLALFRFSIPITAPSLPLVYLPSRSLSRSFEINTERSKSKAN